MSELLFEGYQVPGICYGIDSLLSYSNSNNAMKSVIIVSVGYHCTHVIPILNGRIDTARCKRIDVGGYHITNYLHKLLQLKYPAHINAITLSRAEVIKNIEVLVLRKLAPVASANRITPCQEGTSPLLRIFFQKIIYCFGY